MLNFRERNSLTEIGTFFRFLCVLDYHTSEDSEHSTLFSTLFFQEAFQIVMPIMEVGNFAIFILVANDRLLFKIKYLKEP